mmetsp:Transcript_120248/g.256643  ORF Transcript_120248/g.256643 Transcript_120248/m.256643 type:complete len:459 (-) Transcript_120248:30-1406(-)
MPDAESDLGILHGKLLDASGFPKNEIAYAPPCQTIEYLLARRKLDIYKSDYPVPTEKEKLFRAVSAPTKFRSHSLTKGPKTKKERDVSEDAATAAFLRVSPICQSCHLPSLHKSPRGSSVEDHDAVWNSTVDELAHRGVQLGQLLDFYDKLGTSVMPHFDARRSTTNDVVRQAVIPLSWKPTALTDREGVAYAQIMQQGRPVLAERMVTHNWGNLFAHLVAAIVADALGSPDFGGIIKWLGKRGLPTLKLKLAEKQMLKTVYWICAFSVNQHKGICGGFGTPPPHGSQAFLEWDAKCRDTVTGEVYRVCACPTKKHFNSSRDLCEMNKFDAMMAHLCRVSVGFQQVVAVDKAFSLFQRAWCVAELVEANMLGLNQALQLFSVDSMCDTEFDFSAIRVENCKATRPEDVEEILAKIPDIEQFNGDLQRLLNGQDGLLNREVKHWKKNMKACKRLWAEVR